MLFLQNIQKPEIYSRMSSRVTHRDSSTNSSRNLSKNSSRKCHKTYLREWNHNVSEIIYDLVLNPRGSCNDILVKSWILKDLLYLWVSLGWFSRKNGKKIFKNYQKIFQINKLNVIHRIAVFFYSFLPRLPEKHLINIVFFFVPGTRTQICLRLLSSSFKVFWSIHWQLTWEIIWIFERDYMNNLWIKCWRNNGMKFLVILYEE